MESIKTAKTVAATKEGSNKSVKILLLVAAVLVAVGGVLIYMKTIVSPPQAFKPKNQYEIALNKRISALGRSDADSLEHIFARTTDLAHRFLDEGDIDQKAFDKSYEAIIGTYSPKFAQYCFGQFRKAEWNDAELRWMQGRIGQLRDLTVDNGSRRIMDKYEETNRYFTTIIQTIDQYQKARSLAFNTGFAGLDAARNRISQAGEYRKDDLLCNNASLMNALSNLPSRLEQAHYAHLRSKVESLANYEYISESDFDNLYNSVDAMLKEYSDDAHWVYGTTHDISDLRSDADTYHTLAANFYYYTNTNNENR